MAKEIDERFIDTEDIDIEDLEKVKAESEAKLMRHRLDDYVAIILGVGTCLVLWFLQLIGLY
jgi:hypothetical protein